MDTKHTPGPWAAFRQLVETPPNKDGFCCWIEVTSGKNTKTNRDGVSRAEKQANAALIAAAPELLEALEMTAEYLAAFMEEGRDHKVIQMADRAIAKAKGE